MLMDPFERRIDYLRLSVTEQCNLRCAYCMPVEGPRRIERSDLLTFDEIERMVRILAGLGIRRVRLTGGEPLVRRNLPDLLRRLKAIDGIEEVLLTTNGVYLKALARELKDAGLTKINIHLDTLSPEKFKTITRCGDIQKVFEGIAEAKKIGLNPIKLNAVIQRGVNDDEASDLLRFAAANGLILRFIELMPIGPGRDLMPSAYLPLETLRRRLERDFTLLPLAVRLGSGPAVYYQVAELDTIVGFITALSEPFCASCNRIRISGDGRFQDCLAYDGTFSLRDLLRDPSRTDRSIASDVRRLLAAKHGGHERFSQPEAARTPCMNGIGG